MGIFDSFFKTSQNNDKKEEKEIKSDPKDEFWKTDASVRIDRYSLSKKISYKIKDELDNVLSDNYIRPSIYKNELRRIINSSSSHKEKIVARYLLENLHQFKL